MVKFYIFPFNKDTKLDDIQEKISNTIGCSIRIVFDKSNKELKLYTECDLTDSQELEIITYINYSHSLHS